MQSRKRGHHVRRSTVLEKRAHMPITKRMLKTAEPTIVPMPTSVAWSLFRLRLAMAIGNGIDDLGTFSRMAVTNVATRDR